jgi:hypothetical protein
MEASFFARGTHQVTASPRIITDEIVLTARMAWDRQNASGRFSEGELWRAALEAVADDIRAQPHEIDENAVDATAKAFVEFMGCADIFEGCLKINDEPCPCREVARAAILAYEQAMGK